MEMCSVAKWFGLDPDAVGKWSMPRFTDRQEFMLVSMYVMAQQMQSNKAGKSSHLEPGEKEWKGRRK
jgi:hypothetical protein